MWKYQQREHKKYKGNLSTWRTTCSFTLFFSSCYVVLHHEHYVVLHHEHRAYKKNLYIKQFCGFAEALCYHCRLCTWFNKRGVWNKREGWQNSPKINRECWIRLGRVAKNRIINKPRVPSMRNARVFLVWIYYIIILFKTKILYQVDALLSHFCLLVFLTLYSVSFVWFLIVNQWISFI